MAGNVRDAGGRTGGQVLIDQLRVHDVDTIFCVPGESYLAAIDAMHDAQNDIKIITCRQEGGVTNMADAYAKLTGKPGIAMVTRAPGACNASIGVHTAMQDSSPMVVFIGQVARDQEYREAFQEVDYHQFYGALCKWVVQIDDADRIPELVSQAFHRAMSGRPGPVAVALPEDMLRDLTDVADATPFKVARPGAAVDDIQALRALLESAERPLAILGGGGWTAEATANFASFASANSLPVSVSFRCQDYIDNEHPNYVGELGTTVSASLASHVKEADLLLVVGARMGEMTTSLYSLLDVPTPKQKLVHVYMEPNELGRVYTPDLPIVASMESFAKAALAMKPVANPTWTGWTKQLREEQLQNWKPTLAMTGSLDMHVVMDHLNEVLPDDAVIVSDAGNFSGWPQRFYHYRQYRTQLAPTSGAMGYGIPAAIAARVTHPNRMVVGFAGDGGAMMSGQEFASAVHHGIDPIILVVNNNLYGTIRMHQDRHYPGRDVTTDLTNPDFAKWAQSFGAFGEVVNKTDEFAPAFERAMNAGKIALLELRIDPDMISTRTTLSAIREAALAKG
jgi:acetolactate synthase I/II/III large subunit